MRWTGLMGCWTDSIPSIFISGQVSINQTLGATGLNVRQIGDQEVDIVSMVSPITKYAAMVTDPRKIKLHLDEAFHKATTGRPGPVWLDIPLNIQNAEIDINGLAGQSFAPFVPRPSSEELLSVMSKIKGAKKPLFIVGNGVRLAQATNQMRSFFEYTGIPAITGINGNGFVK